MPILRRRSLVDSRSRPPVSREGQALFAHGVCIGISQSSPFLSRRLLLLPRFAADHRLPKSLEKAIALDAS
ncbi:hypothetical protein FALBO_11809 [Fusarium albosuccineum]|uniref:Uncharacterized protein n=1 Tax=Fusarium albosuccineum TaxID=1237068 RepID=A0A8H4L4D5_9HYPO|nr:hypothetical protein FALBO_11809 [Fusarium albosuccineum]